MTQQTVVAVTGMHRSGTSMLMQMLAGCGLAIGSASDLLPANADNPDGYWENNRFVALNDALLTRMGGSWSQPPDLPSGWSTAANLSDLSDQAAMLIDSFGGSVWGWKDPRTSLTIEFWQRLIPELRLVIGLRNPVEVALSLSTRKDRIGYDQALSLWGTYYHRLMNGLQDGRALLTHYDTYYSDPQTELSRIARWLGLPASDEVIRDTAAVCKPQHRHFQIQDALMPALNVPTTLIDQYHMLLEYAGPVHHTMQDDPPDDLKQANIFDGLIRRIDELHQQNDALSQQWAETQQALGQKELELISAQGYIDYRHSMPGWSVVLLWDRIARRLVRIAAGLSGKSSV